MMKIIEDEWLKLSMRFIDNEWLKLSIRFIDNDWLRFIEDERLRFSIRFSIRFTDNEWFRLLWKWEDLQYDLWLMMRQNFVFASKFMINENIVMIDERDWDWDG